MKEEVLIKSRIDIELKQEFNDIFTNMSEKLIELIKDALQKEKDKYLANIVEYFKDDSKHLEVLEMIIDKIYRERINCESDADGINIIARIQKTAEAKISGTDNKIYSYIYKDILNGLYAGKSSKGSFIEKAERMYRNKAHIVAYVKMKVMGW